MGLDNTPSLQWLMAETVNGLARVDADRLEELVKIAEKLPRQVTNTKQELAEIEMSRQLLGQVLSETRKNLRVFQLIAARSNNQEDPRGYAEISSL